MTVIRVVGSGQESPPFEQKMMETGTHPGGALVTQTALETGDLSERVDKLVWYDLVEEEESWLQEGVSPMEVESKQQDGSRPGGAEAPASVPKSLFAAPLPGMHVPLQDAHPPAEELPVLACLRSPESTLSLALEGPLGGPQRHA